MAPRLVGYLAVSGGGCRNPLLMRPAGGAPGDEVVLADELGAPADAKETILFALLGWCTLHGVPAVLEATGAREACILGTITPGAGPLLLPDPVARVDGLTLRVEA